MEPTIQEQLHEYYMSFNATNSLYSTWAKQHGLSYYTLFTLYAIYYSDGDCYQRSICDEWLMPKQTVNSILKLLEKESYITYEVNEADKRNKKILFTEKGRAYAKPILDALYHLEKTVLEKIDPMTRQQLIDNNTLFYHKLKETLLEEESNANHSKTVLE